MLLDFIRKGATDKSVRIRIIDSIDGTPETGVVFNTSGIDLWYRRELEAKTSITEATLAALTTAHADGGFLHIGDGYYRLDLPDAAFASGANYVEIGGTVTGMVVIGGTVKLIDSDVFHDTVRGGLTALPNAAAEAAGGLYTRGSGAGQLNQQANGQHDVNLERWINVAPLALSSQRVQVLVGAITNGVLVAASFAAGAFDAVWTVAVRVLTAATNITSSGGTTVPQTGDNFARLGAPAGASVSADLAAVKAVLPAALVGGRMDASVGAMANDVITAAALAALASAEIASAVRTELATELGRIDAATSSRASASDMATVLGYIDTEIAAIKAKTDQLTFTNAGKVDSSLQAAADVTNAVLVAIADGLLKRDFSAVSGESARSMLNALRFLRNKWELAAGTLSVKREDDVTQAWSATVTQTAGNPVSAIDPA